MAAKISFSILFELFPSALPSLFPNSTWSSFSISQLGPPLISKINFLHNYSDLTKDSIELNDVNEPARQFKIISFRDLLASVFGAHVKLA